MVNRKKVSEGTGMNVLTACISTTLMLILLGMVIFFVCFAHNFSHRLQENFTVTLMLDENITQQQAYDIQTRLRQQLCVRSLNYVSKEKAQKVLAEELGTEQSEFLGENPMPASFEMRLNAEYANSDSLAEIIPALQADSLIVDVTAPQNLMDSLNRNIRHISIVLLVLALLLTLVSFVLISNTIRLTIYARRLLIRTMRLVGASYAFIRRPFIGKALIIGIVSAISACAILALGICYLIKNDPQMLSLITWQTLAITAASVVVGGIFITWVSAHISVTHYLKMSRGRIYIH